MTTRDRAMAILVAIVWGVCFVVIQRSLPSSAPILLAALRALIGGAIVIAAVSAWRSVRHPRCQGGAAAPASPLRGPRAPLLTVLAVTNVSLAFAPMYLAAGRTDAGLATILGGTQPVLLAAAGVWLRERLYARTAVALALAMAGLSLVAVAGSGATGFDGIVLALTSAAAPALGTVLVRRYGGEVDLLWTTGMTLGLGGLILLAVSATVEPWSAVTWSTEALGSLAFLGVVGTGVAYIVWFRIAARVPVAALGSTLLIVPVVGVVASFADGGQLPAAASVGAMLMLAGVLVAAR